MSFLLRKFALSTAVAITLSGCGGGGEDSQSAPADVSSYVDGSFVYSSESGKSYQNPAYLMSAAVCEQSSRYFESDNFMVFSGAKHSDDQLKKVATVAEQEIVNAASKFGMSDLGQVYEIKRLIGYDDLGDVLNAFRGVTVIDPETSQEVHVTAEQLSDYFANKMPAGSDQWSDPSYYPGIVLNDAFIFNSMMSEEDPVTRVNTMIDMSRSLVEITGNDLLSVEDKIQEHMIHQKIQICVTADSSSAEGSIQGLQIGPDAPRSFFTHELVHFIQKQFTRTMPRWATEGQAVVFAGQRVANSGSGWNPVDVLDFFEDPMYSDSYDQYGRAYVELAKTNNLDRFVQWLRESNHIIIDPETMIQLPREETIKQKFGEIMVDENGDPMSYADFRASL